MRRLIVGYVLVLAAAGHGACSRDRASNVAAITTACGSCHAMPSASSASKEVWRLVLPKMSRWAQQVHPGLVSEREIAAHFIQSAPERLEVREAGTPSTRRFSKRSEVAPSADPDQPAVMCLRELSNAGPEVMLAYCDAERHAIGILALHESTDRAPIPDVGVPVFVELVDVDHDGRQDLLIADIGSARPEMTVKGRVLWSRAAGDHWEPPRELVTGIGRVVGAALADLDRDGQDDLVVAEFGVDSTGGIHVYPVTQLDRPLTTRRTIDGRAGAVGIRIADVDADSNPDIVAAISQQHEQVVLLRNDSTGFSPRVIFEAPTPGWGLIDLEVVDFDRDGDLDIISANGDTFDTAELRPYHGVYLHRQHGETFVTRQIGAFPGVYAMDIGDLDRDGDLDVAASAFVHPRSIAPHRSKRLMSVAWFEQHGDRYSTHPIDAGELDALALEISDVDRDGDLDIVIGNHALEETDGRRQGGETPVLEWYDNTAGALAARPRSQ